MQNHKNKIKYKTLERAPVRESPKAYPSLALDSKPAHEDAWWTIDVEKNYAIICPMKMTSHAH